MQHGSGFTEIASGGMMKMSEISKWSPRGKGLASSAESKTYDRAMDRIRNEAQLSKLENEAVAALAAKSMDLAMDLDDYRRHLADGDPVRDQILAEFELMAVRKMQSNIRGFGGLL